MSASTPATADPPAPPQPDDRSARLMQALLESAGLRLPGDPPEPAPAKPARRRRPQAPSAHR